ncbi:MFS transporter [Bacillus sp. M6-12]|uniref:MDR family MFS transporter n=1 Tax=Bacillus sp. M6-12 TaxID=2054166 RepID=UPI000C767293|nr:MFS transporter [Bacillus sp. M6-12]PLS15860.1 MFS transporter [Bacillus sp. M6-12]
MIKAWREFHPVIKIILSGSVLTSMGNGMIVPYFAIYLGEHSSLSISQIGFFIGASSLAGMFGGFLGGTLSDLLGRRRIMIASLFFSAFILLGLTLQEFPYLLMILTVVKGFTLSFFEPCSKALIADLTESSMRLRAFSMKYFCGNLGFAIGPIIGTILGLTETSAMPFFIAFIIFLTYSIVLNLLLIKFNVSTVSGPAEKVTFQASCKAMMKDRVLFLFLVGGLLATIVHGQFSVTLSQYFYADFQSGLGFLALLWSAHSLVIILFSVPISGFMGKRPPMHSIIIGTALFAAGIAGFGLSINFPAFLISMIVFTIGEIFLIPAEYAIIDEITPDSIRGTYYGAVSFTALGSFIGPGLSGFLLTQFNSQIMFTVLFAIAISSILFYGWGIRAKGIKRELLEVRLKKSL